MTRVARLLRSLIFISLATGLLSAIFILGLRAQGVLEPIELAVYDLLIRTFAKIQDPDPRMTLVTISEDDILRQGRWPITDATLAKALDRILQHHPRAVGVDIYRDIEVPPGLEALNPLLRAHPHIIMVSKFGGTSFPGIPPPPVLKGTEQVGFNDILVDPDGIVRRGLLFLDAGDDVSYAFALRLAILYLAAEGIDPTPDPIHPQHLRLGPTTLRPFEASDGGYVQADASGYQILLDFGGAASMPPRISLTSLLSGPVDPLLFKDKIVLIGVTAESVPDLFHTPYSTGFRAAYWVPGVHLHAQLVSQLLRGGIEGQAPIQTASDTLERIWILSWGLLGGFMGFWARSSWRFALGVGSGIVLIGLAASLSFWQGVWIPAIPACLTWFLAAALVNASALHQERKQRALLMQLFSQHVSGEIAESLWQQRDQFLEGGRPRSQQLVATVLFTDFKGYSSVSEKMVPQALMDWVNTYLAAMTQVIMDHGGVIDDYAGDAIKANFGIPLMRTSEAEIAQDAVNAVRAALAMQDEMHRLNDIQEQRGFPTVGMRIGIYTGAVVAGSVGSQRRLKYTTVGDAVNIAARLESMERDFVSAPSRRRPCRILIGEKTAGYLENRFPLERVGEVIVRGREQPITAYRVLGRNPEGA